MIVVIWGLVNIVKSAS